MREEKAECLEDERMTKMTTNQITKDNLETCAKERIK